MFEALTVHVDLANGEGGNGNAIMNGIEVLKISNFVNNLDGQFGVDGRNAGGSNRGKWLRLEKKKEKIEENDIGITMDIQKRDQLSPQCTTTFSHKPSTFRLGTSGYTDTPETPRRYILYIGAVYGDSPQRDRFAMVNQDE
ncbi:hypothetical protein PIB30_057936 [Stylosanthes scabra]|uniref:Uncharacterized protein n=1 Tax=Stylosanthes scabra TaxID=79078 RepID=A0ABU6UJN7_9FABA|nr:hypothetical protein [Stylosanthes scabra]